jgi:hypothetical protein
MQKEDVEMIDRVGFQQSCSSNGNKSKGRDPSKSTEHKNNKSTSAQGRQNSKVRNNFRTNQLFNLTPA